MNMLPYLVAAWVFLVGCYGLATSRNLIHAVGCLSVCQAGTYVLLLAAALAVGVAPGFADVVAHSVGEAGSAGVIDSVGWTPAGILLGLLSTLLAVGLAALAVTRPKLLAAPDRALPLRRLQSGHVGDYVTWVLVGAVLLGALALPGVLGT
ncbi:hypothetical protein ACWC09_08695 [Streptomyces sp. NPDC001617]